MIIVSGTAMSEEEYCQESEPEKFLDLDFSDLQCKNCQMIGCDCDTA